MALPLGALLLCGSASGQLSSGYEAPTYTGSSAGTIITGQDGFYIPVPDSQHGLVYTYAGNALGLPQNSAGQEQFVGVSGGDTALPQPFARAQRDMTYGDGTGIWTVSFDVAATYLGQLPSAQNLGSFSTQLFAAPSPSQQTFICLARWSDPVTASAWNADYVWFDAAGTQLTEAVPDAAFQNLLTEHWYRWCTVFDLDTNQILEVSITDLASGNTATHQPVGRYMFGGTTGSATGPPTGFRYFAGTNAAGAAGNTLAFDNLVVEPGQQPCPVRLPDFSVENLAGCPVSQSHFQITYGIREIPGSLDFAPIEVDYTLTVGGANSTVPLPPPPAQKLKLIKGPGWADNCLAQSPPNCATGTCKPVAYVYTKDDQPTAAGMFTYTCSGVTEDICLCTGCPPAPVKLPEFPPFPGLPGQFDNAIVTIVLDPENLIAESDENNNVAQILVVHGPPSCPTGACCSALGVCMGIQTQSDCESGGGFYQGDGTFCLPGLCVPRGACVLPDGTCVVGTQAQCAEFPGNYQGDGTTCGAPCPEDVDGDGTVAVGDMVVVILDWACTGTCEGDVNGDGVTNVDDLVTVILAWGPC